MDISLYLDTEMLAGFFKDMVVIGFLPGFMLTACLHLLAYGIFKALAFLNIKP